MCLDQKYTFCCLCRDINSGNEDGTMTGYICLPPFDKAGDKWPTCYVRLEAFFKANAVSDKKKQPHQCGRCQWAVHAEEGQ